MRYRNEGEELKLKEKIKRRRVVPHMHDDSSIPHFYVTGCSVGGMVSQWGWYYPIARTQIE